MGRPDHGDGCNDECKALLTAGLDYGLTTIGLPPDIPNFDQLVELGKGHVADMLVAEATLQSPATWPNGWRVICSTDRFRQRWRVQPKSRRNLPVFLS